MMFSKVFISLARVVRLGKIYIRWSVFEFLRRKRKKKKMNKCPQLVQLKKTYLYSTLNLEQERKRERGGEREREREGERDGERERKRTKKKERARKRKRARDREIGREGERGYSCTLS